MTAKDFMKSIVRKYRGEWISISLDYKKVFAHSKDMTLLVEKLNKNESKKGIIMRVPTKMASAYVGYFWRQKVF